MRTNTTPRPLMGHYVGLVLEAIENHTLRPSALEQGLDGGTLLLVWSGPGLPPPSYCRPGGLIDEGTPAGAWTGLMINALINQAYRYGADGLDFSACDCWWLVAKLRAGALQLVSADTMAALQRAAALVGA